MARNKTCSFCGRDASEVGTLIHGPGNVAICNECVKTCQDILKANRPTQGQNDDYSDLEVPTPKEIKEYLDQYVIGQESAKRVLSVAVYNHYKRVKFSQEIADQDIEMDKSNILLIGPTGTGKTLLARTLAKKLNVPFAIADATTLTQAGYVGEDVENILLKLIQAADNDISRAEKGIIFIDEIDKIAKKGENVSITRDVSGEGVQQALLKIIEGTVASVPPQGGRKHPNQEMLRIDTTNILFICGGAFVGLDKIIENRVANQTMGFGANVESADEKSFDELLKELHPDDLIKFGLIPEFIGRLPIHVSLENLTKEDLKRIIVEPKNSVIRQYIVNMSLDGVKLVFTDDAIDAIAQTAIDQNTGARGIRSIVEQMMLDISFDIPSEHNIKQVTMTADCVNGKGKPVIEYTTDQLPSSRDLLDRDNA